MAGPLRSWQWQRYMEPSEELLRQGYAIRKGLHIKEMALARDGVGDGHEGGGCDILWVKPITKTAYKNEKTSTKLARDGVGDGHEGGVQRGGDAPHRLVAADGGQPKLREHGAAVGGSI